MGKTDIADIRAVITIRSDNLKLVICIRTNKHHNTTHGNTVILVSNKDPWIIRVRKNLLTASNRNHLKIARSCCLATSETDIGNTHKISAIRSDHFKQITAIHICKHLHTAHRNRVTFAGDKTPRTCLCHCWWFVTDNFWRIIRSPHFESDAPHPCGTLSFSHYYLKSFLTIDSSEHDHTSHLNTLTRISL